MTPNEKLKLFEKAAAKSGARVGIHIANHKSLGATLRTKLVLIAVTLAAGIALIGNDDQTDQGRESLREMESSGRLSIGTVDNANTLAEQREIELRNRLTFIEVTYKGRATLMLDPASRIELTKSASDEANLAELGLSWSDLYGLIQAETGWISRDGMGKNGVISKGLAQFEPATAKAFNLKNPEDPVESVMSAARLMKEAGVWAKSKVKNAKLHAHHQAAAIRAGVSVYYNLSTRGRAEWVPMQEANLPMETRAHIANSAEGAKIAKKFDKQLIEFNLMDQANEKILQELKEKDASSPRMRI